MTDAAESADRQAVRNRDPYALLPDSGTLETDRVLRLLSDYRRRHVLTYLLRNEDWTQLSNVADYILTTELGIDAGAVPNERKRLYTALYHTHVPMLAESGYVAYDQERDRVRATPATERFVPFLELACDRGGLSAPSTERYRDDRGR